MSDAIQIYLKNCKTFRASLAFDASLKSKTSFQCQSSAAAIFAPKNLEALEHFLKNLSAEGYALGKDVQVIGKGSNTLFEDVGFAGCLIDLSALDKIETIEKNHHWNLRAQAGLGMGSLLQRLRKASYTGFEFSFGIPGSVGGGIRMNAGTPEGWFGDVLESVEGFDCHGTYFKKTVTPQDFLYRDFPFGHGKILTAGTFRFQKSSQKIIEEKIKIAKIKRAEQPLHLPNFGSVFKNPKPHYAGALIEAVGLKGHGIGSARISGKHANFIVNDGYAKTDDVKALIALAQKKVWEHHNIQLKTEVHILGG